MITTVEDLCNVIGYELDDQEGAMCEMTNILLYLQSQGVIKEYNTRRLEWLFGDKETY